MPAHSLLVPQVPVQSQRDRETQEMSVWNEEVIIYIGHRFPNLGTYWNHRGGGKGFKKKPPTLFIPPRDADVIGLGCSVGTEFFKAPQESLMHSLIANHWPRTYPDLRESQVGAEA